MELSERQFIDWKKTGRNLQLLRNDNLELRRFVCYTLNFEKGECDGDCKACVFQMDTDVSRNELARVFNVSESVIFNWENGKTPVSLDDILFYCRIAKTDLDRLIVYRD